MLFFNFRLIDEGSSNKDKQKHHRTLAAHCCPVCIMNFKRQSMSWTAKIKFINKPDIFCNLQVKLTFNKNVWFFDLSSIGEELWSKKKKKRQNVKSIIDLL